MGAHADVGVGYVDAGLANVALVWMISYTVPAFHGCILCKLLDGFSSAQLGAGCNDRDWKIYKRACYAADMQTGF
jgi:hypothetical protein